MAGPLAGTTRPPTVGRVAPYPGTMPIRAHPCDHPVMPNVAAPVDQRLSDAIADAADMLTAVRSMLPEQTNTGPHTGTIGRHAPESHEPWNQPAADAYWNLHFGPSKLIAGVRYELGLRRVPDDRLPVGWEAMSTLGRLLGAAPEALIKRVTNRLESWATAARRVPGVGEEEDWAPVPAIPGAKPPECPYCGTFGLRMLRLKGEVRCFLPGCRDADGNPTRARMERGKLTGDGMLVFRDGTTLAFGGEH